MRVSLGSLLGAAALIGACAASSAPTPAPHASARPSAPRAAPAPPSVASAPPADASAPAPPSDPCEPLAREIGGPALFACQATSRGAWAIRIDAPSGVSPDLTLVISHVDPEGKRQRVERRLRDAEVWFSGIDLGRALVVHDFDGDGDPELFARISAWGYDERVLAQVFVRHAQGRVEDYRPAAGMEIAALSDFDGDGLLDANVEVHVGWFKGCDWCAGRDVTRSFRARGRPGGTFAMGDELALKPLRDLCRAPAPRALVRAADDDIDLDALLCGRLRGVTTDALLARLRAECQPHRVSAAACQGPCRYLGLAEAYARFVPPVRL